MALGRKYIGRKNGVRYRDRDIGKGAKRNTRK